MSKTANTDVQNCNLFCKLLENGKLSYNLEDLMIVRQTLQFGPAEALELFFNLEGFMIED